MKLLDRLIAIQNAKNLSSREFALLLGVSHQTWADTRKGLPIRYQVLAGAVKAFGKEYPAIKQDVLDHLESDGSALFEAEPDQREALA